MLTSTDLSDTLIYMTDFLFAKPSILEGAARTIDLFGVLQVYNISDTPIEADQKAIMADWLAIGNDFKKAIASAHNERTAE